MSATQKFFRFPFALNGDRLAVPDVTPVDGSVGYQIGYGFDYQRAPGDGLVKNLERNKWNQLLYEITLGLRQYQTLGFPEFITAADNGGFPYPYAKNAFVRWTDGQVYVSMVDNNTAEPSDVAKWSLGILGTGIGAVQFFPANTPPVGYVKANGAVLSRAAYPALWAYAQASNNLAVSEGAWQSGQFSPGDGVNTFRIPDARGYHPRAWDDGRGLDSGRVLGSVQSDAFPSHAHGVNDPGHGHGIFDPAHSHGVFDPGHGHGVSDPGHAHITDIPVKPNNPGAGAYAMVDGSSGLIGTQATGSRGSGTGIGVNNAGSNIAVNASGTGISVGGSGVGISIAAAGSGSENRVKTVAWLACIKYL